MSNFLESIPCDILQYIALLATLGSQPVLTTPRPVSMLLLTSSTLYRSLCVKSCPHLYANIFRATFDTRAGRRRFTFQLTDSALACELLFRHKMLRNVRHRSCLPAELRQDLWTAFWMVQESDGLNELHLRLAGLVEYLLDIVKRWTGDTISISRESGPTRELQSLVIWLLCFTLSRGKLPLIDTFPPLLMDCKQNASCHCRLMSKAPFNPSCYRIPGMITG